MADNISKEIIKKYSKLAVDAFMEDPLYKAISKNKFIRKIVIYNTIYTRMSIFANKGVTYYFDEQDRGLLILRHVLNDAGPADLLKAPNLPVLLLFLPYTIRLFTFQSGFNNEEVIGNDAYVIAPLFVGKEYQKQGVARKLIQRAVDDVGAQYKIGLDTQNPVNLPFYEKMGFEVVGHTYYEDKDINNYYLVRKPGNGEE